MVFLVFSCIDSGVLCVVSAVKKDEDEIISGSGPESLLGS